jgi:hypothetical protein
MYLRGNEQTGSRFGDLRLSFHKWVGGVLGRSYWRQAQVCMSLARATDDAVGLALEFILKAED